MHLSPVVLSPTLGYPSDLFIGDVPPFGRGCFVGFQEMMITGFPLQGKNLYNKRTVS
jgi:hypothetical protein